MATRKTIAPRIAAIDPTFTPPLRSQAKLRPIVPVRLAVTTPTAIARRLRRRLAVIDRALAALPGRSRATTERRTGLEFGQRFLEERLHELAAA